MKLYLGELRQMIDALPIFMEKELPVKTSYWLQKTLKQLMVEYEPFEATRQTLVKKHAKRGENGQLLIEGTQYVLEDMDAFNEEYNEIAGQEIEIASEPIPIDAFGDIQIKGSDLAKLGALIKDE